MEIGEGNVGVDGTALRWELFRLWMGVAADLYREMSVPVKGEHTAEGGIRGARFRERNASGGVDRHID